MIIKTLAVVAMGLFLSLSPKQEVSVTVDKEEAKKAFEYLNTVRLDPVTHGKDLGIDLKATDKKHALIWNDTLARIAEERATDMAKRKYFSHINPDGEGVNIIIHRSGYKLRDSWIKDKKQNNFESIQAGASTAVYAIQSLLIDKFTPGEGHRKHLLGQKLNGMDFYGKLKDIGIGFVRAEGAPFKTYTVVIIAMHDF